MEISRDFISYFEQANVFLHCHGCIPCSGVHRPSLLRCPLITLRSFIKPSDDPLPTSWASNWAKALRIQLCSMLDIVQAVVSCSPSTGIDGDDDAAVQFNLDGEGD